MIATYGENVRQYLENKGDDVRLFFLPTETEERISCINPVYIDEQEDFDRLQDLIEDLTNKFQIGVE
jgi:spore coat polysaccharide biosynthesis protein SpsF (cytidylyltransferase family)